MREQTRSAKNRKLRFPESCIDNPDRFCSRRITTARFTAVSALANAKSAIFFRYPTGDEEDRAIAYIARYKEIRDVIVSGGDPLSLSNNRLDQSPEKIYAIPHVEIIRIGTRNLVTLPQRTDDELVEILSRFQTKMDAESVFKVSNEMSLVEIYRFKAGGYRLPHCARLLLEKTLVSFSKVFSFHRITQGRVAEHS